MNITASTPMQRHERLHMEGISHGYFGRNGGVSTGIYGSLNCGLGSDDDRDLVLENRDRLLSAMSSRPKALVTPHQVHSPDCLIVDAPWPEKAAKVDALATDNPELVIAVATADCGPVLFADSDAQVVAAAHAGWKGALYGVLDSTIDAMVQLGAKRERIVAILGPTISLPSYEVRTDFRDGFAQERSEYAQYFLRGKDDEHFQFDLPRFIVERLKGLGVGFADWTGHCTYELESDYFSYRRSTHRREIDYGRQLAAISVR